MRGYTNVVQKLIEKGSEVSVPDMDGYTALHVGGDVSCDSFTKHDFKYLRLCSVCTGFVAVKRRVVSKNKPRTHSHQLTVINYMYIMTFYGSASYYVIASLVLFCCFYWTKTASPRKLCRRRS